MVTKKASKKEQGERMRVIENRKMTIATNEKVGGDKNSIQIEKKNLKDHMEFLRDNGEMDAANVALLTTETIL